MRWTNQHSWGWDASCECRVEQCRKRACYLPRVSTVLFSRCPSHSMEYAPFLCPFVCFTNMLCLQSARNAKIMEGSVSIRIRIVFLSSLSLPVLKFFEAKREDVEYFFVLVFVYGISSLFYSIYMYIWGSNWHCMDYMVKANWHQRRMILLKNSTPLSVWERGR